MTTYKVHTEETMQQLGEQLAKQLLAPSIVYLHGDLGAGKTTLVRGILRGLGYHGRVKSPTYTLVEPYHVNHQPIYHFDLYRLQTPEELEGIGFRDYLSDNAIVLIEWPEKAAGFLPKATMEIMIQPEAEARIITIS